MWRALWVPTAALFACLAGGCQQAPVSTSELQAALAVQASPTGISREVWADTLAFYSRREQKLAWTWPGGPTSRTSDTLAMLRNAEDHGLDPASYGEPELRKVALALQEGEHTPDPHAIADLDVRLTASLLALGRHVAVGRLSPKTIDARWNSRREAPDYVAALERAAEGDLASFLDTVQPRHPEYVALVRALTALRAHAGEGWATVPRTTLKRRQWNRAVVPLRQRLAAGGYLSGTASLDSAHFDADVEAGIKGFQGHHGLPQTGVLDRSTIDRMNVPIERRLTQLALNLERWRWLPDDLGARHLLVNVPRFHLFAREHGKVVLDMRVVVGKRGNETPLFSDEMETVVFSPYWNVPETIALEETAPAVARDPDFLSRNNMEVIDASGQVVAEESIPWGDEAALANYRFRQRPGANNALGHVKFLFPNEHVVYLHDTPADALFTRIGRAFSHGCVRLEEPHALAKYVLGDQPQWTQDAIADAMHAGHERHVKLSARIPVHIVYFTAWVDEHGGLHFEPDVYGYDARQASR